MLPTPKNSRKRAAPDSLTSNTDENLQPAAANAEAAGQQPHEGPPLSDITNSHQPDIPHAPPRAAQPAFGAVGSPAALKLPTTPERLPKSDPAAVAALVASPGRNRQMFLAQMTPQHMTCDLSSAVVGLGVKHNLQAILVACYPAQKGPPARRHVTLRDQCGATGSRCA